jgi:pyrroline-5-carboxylate reductase
MDTAKDRSVAVRSVGIIGVGEIARAIVEGLCSGGDTPPDVILSPRGAAVSAELARRYSAVRVCADNQQVADNASLLIIAVRPDSLEDALAGLRVPSGSLVVSVVAGVDHQSLRRLLGSEVTIVRAIPLPAVRRRTGITAVHPPHPTVSELFDRLGGTLETADAAAFAALWATTGTISTYLRYLATIAQWAENKGVDRVEANHYVRRMFLGVAGGLADETRSLSELSTDHETPAGLNEQLRQAWFDTANTSALHDALDDLFRRLT